MIFYIKKLLLKKLFIKILLSYCTFVYAFTSLCQAMNTPHITELSLVNKLSNNTQITAPYQLLSGTTYTSDINVYSYQNYTLKVINKKNPDKLLLHIKKHVHVNISEAHANTDYKLPYWSNFGPNILKTLDFTKVDGKEKQYVVGADYRLTMLDTQGAWGKVYVLEHFSEGMFPEIICAVKILLTRVDERNNMTVQDFRKRHKQEIDSNVQLVNLGLDIAIKTYGIIANDPDHYLLFLEYGKNARDKLKSESENAFIDHMHNFMNQVDALHSAGYAHGDLKIDNMLFVNNVIKLCDWFSFSAFTKEYVGAYRYSGDNLPPEAMRALYYRDNNELLYAKVHLEGKEMTYFLHPITTDRFCLAFSVLEIIAPDFYRRFDQLFYKGFNPYSPESLDFWQKHILCLKAIQNDLLLHAEKESYLKKREIFLRIAKYIDVDPLQRN